MSGDLSGPTYRLRTFGGLGLEPSNSTLGQHKRLALLAILAHAGKTGLSRDRVAAHLWPDSDTDRARNALYQLVHGIRRELGDGAIQSFSAKLRLSENHLSSDVADFRAAFECGELERAAAAYTGPFLDGVHLRNAPEFERWCDEVRRELETMYHDVLDRLARDVINAGDDAAAVHWTRLRTTAEPVSTRAALAYIRALVTAGDRGAALDHAQLHVTMVRTHLDAEPDAAFQRYIAAVRDGAIQPAAAPSATPSRAVADAPAIAASVIEPIVVKKTGPLSRRKRTVALLAGLSIVSLTLTAQWLPPSSLVTGATTALTSGQAVEQEPAVSPDGKFIAYVAGRPGQMVTRSSSNSIYVKQIAGGRAVPLTPDSTIGHRSPRWSPDGTRIAYSNPLGIFVVPAFGGVAQRLVADSGHSLSIGQWSPDGKHIAFSDDRGVWVRDIAGGAQRHVTTTGFAPHSVAWSPDASLLAFVVGTGGSMNVAPSSIWIVSSSGGTPERITDVTRLNTSPVFTPDGRSLLFVSNRDGTRDVYRQTLWRKGAWGRPTRLTTGTNAINISLSADGGRLAYGALALRSNIWSAPIPRVGTATTADATPLTSGNQEIECVAVSPDGRWLIYDSNKNGHEDIYKMPLDGGEATQLTTDPADDFCGRMSPDGREIVFYTFRDGGRRRVYTMRADGSAQTPITDSVGQQRAPRWDATGNRIAFLSDRGGRQEVYLVSRTAAGWSAPRAAGVPKGTAGAAWSPDGRFLALSRDSGLMIVPTDSTVKPFWLARPSPPGPGKMTFVDVPYFAWSAKPSVLFYRTSSSTPPSEFWAVDPAGGPSRLVLRFGDGVHVSRAAGFDTDGKRIYFTVASDEASVFMIELKR